MLQITLVFLCLCQIKCRLAAVKQLRSPIMKRDMVPVIVGLNTVIWK